MTEEATNLFKTVKPFRFNIEFLQELDGILLAESIEDAEQDILEKGATLPNFNILKLVEISKEEYISVTSNNATIQKETLN